MDIALFKKHVKILELVQTVSNMDFEATTNELMDTFEEAFITVEHAHVWYTAMKSIYKHFCTYDLQAKSSSHNFLLFMSKLEEWTKNVKSTPVAADNFNKEFRKICDKNIDTQIDFAVSLHKLKHLQTLCKLAFPKTSAEVVANRMHVKGSHLLLSKIVAQMQDNISELEIFASEKVFIDCDFLAVGKKMQIFIAAPTWEVIGEHRKIVLDGAPGQAHSAAAGNGTVPGGRGNDGMSGFPGGCGGNFLGVGIDFKNADNLEVTARGGRGGDGQNGGEGQRGRKGDDAKVPANVFEAEFRSSDQFRIKEDTTFYLVHNSKENTVDFKLAGKNGDCGGDGGNGGCGGIGGYPGQVLFIGCGSSNVPKTIAHTGENGQNGKGGRGGLGGKRGDTVKGTAERSAANAVLVLWKVSSTTATQKIESEVTAEAGQEGESGRSNICSQEREHCEYKNFVQLLSEYTVWYSCTVETQSENTRYIKHLQKICKSTKWINVQSLAAEVMQTERGMVAQRDLDACRDKYILLKFSILNLSSITPNLKDEDKKMLCFLYLIALFRHASNLKEVPQLEVKAQCVCKAIQEVQVHNSAQKEKNILENIWSKLEDYKALALEIDELAGVSVPIDAGELMAEEIRDFTDLLTRKFKKKSMFRGFGKMIQEFVNKTA